MYHREVSLVALAMALAWHSETVDARSVLVDESHDQEWPLSSHEGFASAREALVADGHTLTALTGTPGAITDAALAGHDVFYTGTLSQGYLPGEIEVLQRFVARGGGVIVGHDAGWASDASTPSVNAFLAPYGVQMAPTSTFPNGLVVSGFVSHCVTEGIDVLGLDRVREISALSFPAVNMTANPPYVMAVTDVNPGWVIVLGDDSLWMNQDYSEWLEYDIGDFDNLTILLSVFGYDVCSPISVEVDSWSEVKALYRNRG